MSWIISEVLLGRFGIWIENFRGVLFKICSGIFLMDVWKSSFLPFLLHFASYTSFPPRSLIHNVNGSWWSLSKVHWCAAGCWNSDSMCTDFLGICSLNIKQSPAVLGAAVLSWNLICCYMHQWFVTFFEGTEVWAFPCSLVCQLLRCLYPLVNRSMTLWLPALLVSPCHIAIFLRGVKLSDPLPWPVGKPGSVHGWSGN